MKAARLIEGGDARSLIICDHASNKVPPEIALGVPPAVMLQHVAYDIGAEAVSEELAKALDCPAWMATISRLVCDVNRPPEASIVPHSDGIMVPGNHDLAFDATELRHDLHRQFHDGLAELIASRQPRLMISIHSFTPALASAPADRPWPIAVLWNEDERASIPAIAMLNQEPDLGGPVGANEPYSGKVLNYTMDRHAEDKGVPYLGFEIRQDLISDAAGVARWTDIVARCVRATEAALWAGA